MRIAALLLLAAVVATVLLSGTGVSAQNVTSPAPTCPDNGGPGCDGACCDSDKDWSDADIDDADRKCVKGAGECCFCTEEDGCFGCEGSCREECITPGKKYDLEKRDAEAFGREPRPIGSNCCSDASSLPIPAVMAAFLAVLSAASTRL